MSAMTSQTTSVLIFLLNRSFRRSSKKTSKLRVTRRCEGNPPVTGGFLSLLELIFEYWVDINLLLKFNHVGEWSSGMRKSLIMGRYHIEASSCNNKADQTKIALQHKYREIFDFSVFFSRWICWDFAKSMTAMFRGC